MQVLVDLYKRESEHHRQVLLTQLRRRLAPQNNQENAAVEEMATAQWRIERLWQHEVGLIDDQLSQIRALHPDADSETAVALTMNVLSQEGGAFDTIDGMEARYNREYAQAFDRLALLRAKTENFQTN
jgi:hypothetical protein